MYTGDWEDTDYAIPCPFCDDSVLESTREAFEHCKDCHDFDFLEIKKRLRKSLIDFRDYCKPSDQF